MQASGPCEDTTVELDMMLTPGLGNASYLLASGDEAAAIDPPRDAWRLLEALGRRRLRLVLETHVHNDYVSGALELREATGAHVVAPARGGYAFPILPVDDGDELELGDLRLVALATPGHTPEHTAYAVHAAGSAQPSAVFTGGSLLVGTAGRTDLLGEDRAEELARAQYRSIRRLAELPDATLVLPTHGAGSFCASGPPDEQRTTTIGRERASNPAVRARDAEGFLRSQGSGSLAFPAYYAHMAPINRAGPPVRGAVPRPPSLAPDAVERSVAAGARLVDTRDGASVAAGHVPGSLNVPLEDPFASYVGWLVPYGSPIVLIAEDPTSLAEAALQLFRIGWEPVGHLAGGVEAWAASGRPLGSYPTVDASELAAEAARCPERVLDVRQRAEWEDGHLPGTRHRFVGDLPTTPTELLGPGPLTVACASGHRAAIAASALAAAGIEVRLVARGGIPDLLTGSSGDR